MDGNLDLGVVSFGSVMISSSYMLGVLSSGSMSFCKSAKVATTCTQVLVAINYFLGAVLGFTALGRPGFGIYCAIFEVLWLGIAYCGQLLMKSMAMGGGSLPLSS